MVLRPKVPLIDIDIEHLTAYVVFSYFPCFSFLSEKHWQNLVQNRRPWRADGCAACVFCINPLHIEPERPNQSPFRFLWV